MGGVANISYELREWEATPLVGAALLSFSVGGVWRSVYCFRV